MRRSRICVVKLCLRAALWFHSRIRLFPSRTILSQRPVEVGFRDLHDLPQRVLKGRHRVCGRVFHSFFPMHTTAPLLDDLDGRVSVPHFSEPIQKGRFLMNIVLPDAPVYQKTGDFIEPIGVDLRA